MLPLLVLNLESSVFIASPVGTTDPDAATLVEIVFAGPTYETDPMSATVIVITTPNPMLSETDPMAATVVTP
jgi:hypothetical protein